MGCRLFYFVFFYSTEKNFKQVISLGEEEAFSKYYGTMFLKPLSSSNTGFAPETSAKIFCPVY